MSAELNGTDVENFNGSVNVGDLDKDGSATLTLVVKAIAAGTVENTASVKSDKTDPQNSNEVTTVITGGNIAFTIYLVDENGNPLSQAGQFAQGGQGIIQLNTLGNQGNTEAWPADDKITGEIFAGYYKFTVGDGEREIPRARIVETRDYLDNPMSLNYAFDMVDEERGNPAEGFATTDITIYAVYSPDQIGPDGPDDIPDKYQVVARFISSDPETVQVTGNTFQVFTLTDGNGKYTVSGTVTLELNDIALDPDTYTVKEWKGQKGGMMSGQSPATIPSIISGNRVESYPVKGGDMLIFTAWFESGLEVTKTRTSTKDVVTEGDTIEWEIKITNNSGEEQTVSLNDTLRISGMQVRWPMSR